MCVKTICSLTSEEGVFAPSINWAEVHDEEEQDGAPNHDLRVDLREERSMLRRKQQFDKAGEKREQDIVKEPILQRGLGIALTSTPSIHRRFDFRFC